MQAGALPRRLHVGALHERLEAVPEGAAELVALGHEPVLDRLQHGPLSRASDDDATLLGLAVGAGLGPTDRTRSLHRRLDQLGDGVAEGDERAVRHSRCTIAR